MVVGLKVVEIIVVVDREEAVAETERREAVGRVLMAGLVVLPVAAAGGQTPDLELEQQRPRGEV